MAEGGTRCYATPHPMGTSFRVPGDRGRAGGSRVWLLPRPGKGLLLSPSSAPGTKPHGIFILASVLFEAVSFSCFKHSPALSHPGS